MKSRDLVSDIMTREVVTVSKKTRLKEAEKLMKNKGVRHIPVVDGDKLVGILSLNDLLRLSFVDSYGYEEDEAIDTAIYQMLRVGQVMVEKPKTVLEDEPIEKVARIFVEEDFHALPVISKGNLTGIITTTDVIRYMLENC